MFEFILSKINMLILVTALFVIVAYFTFSVGDLMKVHESQLMLGRLRDKAEVMIISDTYCDSVYHYFPEAIRVTGKDLYYEIKVSKEHTEVCIDPPACSITEEFYYLIFSLFPRREYEAWKANPTTADQPGAFAAESVRVDAAIHIYRVEPGGTIMPATAADPALIDPQGDPATDAIVFVKQKEAGDVRLYVIPCLASMCDVYKEQASCMAAGLSAGCLPDDGAFKC